ncbi:SRPBCC domain-containing protein [Leucobacter sp.]
MTSEIPGAAARPVDPRLDLTLHRLIRAPREIVWRAWSDPERLAQWWIPAPARARVDRLELQPGGAFVTSMSDDGVDFAPHVDAVFLQVERGRRLVFTNAVDSAWRPARPSPIAMTAEIRLTDDPEGTSYDVLVRHGDPEGRALHEELGFFEGWGSVTTALAELAERERREA